VVVVVPGGKPVTVVVVESVPANTILCVFGESVVVAARVVKV